MELVLLKVIHVLSAVIAVGANTTYAVWLRAAGRDSGRLAFAIEGIRRIDRRVANPAYIVLAITGVAMVARGMYSFQTPWIALSIVLYVAVAVLGAAVFAPAIARLGEEASDPTSPAFAAASRRTTIVGSIATVIALAIIVLMVAKPG